MTEQQQQQATGPVDLDEAQRLIDDAEAESGPWSIEIGVDGGGGEEGIWVEVLGDGPNPSKAAVAFIRESRDREARMAAELRAAREVVGRTRWLVGNHVEIGDCTCLEALVIELAAYDKATGGAQ